jgi:hypothetical protein
MVVGGGNSGCATAPRELMRGDRKKEFSSCFRTATRVHEGCDDPRK